MSEPHFNTGNKRDGVCSCGAPVVEVESRGMYGSGPTWSKRSHDAPCGRPCLAGGVSPRDVRERYGLGIRDMMQAVHGSTSDGRRVCPDCGDLGEAPPPAPVVDPHEDGGGFEDVDEAEAEAAVVAELRRELAGYQERENRTLTDSEAFRAGFTEGNLAHLHGEPHPLLAYGWGGLDALLERREEELRAKLAAAEQARDRLRDLALDACAVIDGGGAYCCDCGIGPKADALRADIEAVPRG